jgi:hypothetical protein
LVGKVMWLWRGALWLVEGAWSLWRHTNTALWLAGGQVTPYLLLALSTPWMRRGRTDYSSTNFNLCFRWKWVVNLHPDCSTKNPGKKLVRPRVHSELFQNEINLFLPGYPDRSARAPVVITRLRYPGSTEIYLACLKWRDEVDEENVTLKCILKT